MLAFCLLVEPSNDDLRKEIRKSFVELIASSDELLTFIFVYHVLKSKLNFGRGLRVVLKKWYDNQSSNQLFDILYGNRKHSKMDHKTILHQLHLKLDDVEKNKILHSFYKKYEDQQLTADSSLLDKMIKKYRELKHCQDCLSVIEILKAKEFPYKLHQIPTFARKNYEVVDLVLPNMTLKEVIDNLSFFCSQKLLRVQEPVSRKICNALQANHKVINDSKLHPLYIFNVMKDLERRLTITLDDTHKNENGNGNAADVPVVVENKEKRLSNPYIIKKLQFLFNHTLNGQPKTGCRYFVTVDFRAFSKRQSYVFGMDNNVMCSELQAIISLVLLKNEKDVTVMSFTSDKNNLKPVAWNNETNFSKAIEIYEKEIVGFINELIIYCYLCNNEKYFAVRISKNEKFTCSATQKSNRK
jgi:hypothetical protein